MSTPGVIHSPKYQIERVPRLTYGGKIDRVGWWRVLDVSDMMDVIIIGNKDGANDVNDKTKKTVIDIRIAVVGGDPVDEDFFGYPILYRNGAVVSCIHSYYDNDGKKLNKY